jgi:PiT family inorganic phosphate transporter
MRKSAAAENHGDGDHRSRGRLCLPVSTTHVLSSSVAGIMAANKSGTQLSTVRNLAPAWVLTLPVAMVLSGSLF